MLKAQCLLWLLPQCLGLVFREVPPVALLESDLTRTANPRTVKKMKAYFNVLGIDSLDAFAKLKSVTRSKAKKLAGEDHAKQVKEAGKDIKKAYNSVSLQLHPDRIFKNDPLAKQLKTTTLDPGTSESARADAEEQLEERIRAQGAKQVKVNKAREVIAEIIAEDLKGQNILVAFQQVLAERQKGDPPKKKQKNKRKGDRPKKKRNFERTMQKGDSVTVSQTFVSLGDGIHNDSGTEEPRKILKGERGTFRKYDDEGNAEVFFYWNDKLRKSNPKRQWVAWRDLAKLAKGSIKGKRQRRLHELANVYGAVH